MSSGLSFASARTLLSQRRSVPRQLQVTRNPQRLVATVPEQTNLAFCVHVASCRPRHMPYICYASEVWAASSSRRVASLIRMRSKSLLAGLKALATPLIGPEGCYGTAGLKARPTEIANGGPEGPPYGTAD